MRRVPTPSLLVFAIATLLAFPAAAGADEAQGALRDLARALRQGEPALRRDAVRRVGSLSGLLDPAQRRRGAVALRKALAAERDDDVRAEMVTTLAELGGSAGWVPVILASLREPEGVVRGAARQAVLRGRGDYLEVVTRLLAEDQDPTFRAEVVLLLGDRRREDAVGLLVDTLSADHPRVVAAAAEALEAITSEAFGYDQERWRGWWAARATGVPSRGEAREDGAGTGSVTVAPPLEVAEPEPHVTRALIPSFHGLALRAKDVVFVVDVSGSVGTAGVVRLKRELVDAVERLGSDVRVTALFFDEEVHLWRPAMVPATPSNKADLAHFVRGIRAGRRTDLFTPLHVGLQIVRRRVQEKVEAGEPFREAVALFVVSDGVDTAGATPAAVVRDKLDRLDPARTVVHTIVIGGKDNALLFELARAGGGHYLVVR